MASAPFRVSSFIVTCNAAVFAVAALAATSAPVEAASLEGSAEVAVHVPYVDRGAVVIDALALTPGASVGYADLGLELAGIFAADRSGAARDTDEVDVALTYTAAFDFRGEHTLTASAAELLLPNAPGGAAHT